MSQETAPPDEEELVATQRRRRHWTAFLVLRPSHPAQVVVGGFALAVLLSTALLMLPFAHEPGQPRTTFLQALFTATSSVCVNGLIVVDTATHWSTFGEVVIMVGIQAGGFGFMTSASLFGLMVSRRLGLRTRLLTMSESPAVGLGDVGRVLRRVAIFSLLIEGAVAAVVAIRLAATYGLSPGAAAYGGVFHSISAFNNAGFALYPDSLMSFASDAWILLPLCVGVVLGGIGFPVLLELRRELRTPRSWSLHTKITVTTSAVLVGVGTLAFLAFEWSNPGTIGGAGIGDKLLLSFTQGGVMPRSAGFNAIDYGAAQSTTLLATDGLMFIGGGSAGTAGGIKVTTFAVLLFAILAEVRGDSAAEAFGRRIPAALLRQALTIVLLGIALVVCATLALLALSTFSLDQTLFESISAFATVGASTGITPFLPHSAQYVLVALMFVGRTGSITLATALALRERRRLYQLPEERTLIG